jgi:DNA (cytosine-5-)-methyltransferase
MTNEALNMDCMDYMRKCSDKQFNLAIVDPPYGIGESGAKNRTRDHLAKAKDYHPIFGKDKAPPDIEYFNELKRVSKNQIIWGANHFVDLIPFKSPCWLVWDKDNGKADFADCELAYTSFNSAVRKFTFRWNGMLQGNMKHKEGRIHPHQKPVALYKWILSHYAKAGDIILDTHLGSGSSRIAAYDMGFDFIGTEIDSEYFEEQEKRFKDHCAQGCLFTFSGGEVVK